MSKAAGCACRVTLLCLFFCLPNSGVTDEAASALPSPGEVWFRPVITTSNSPSCAQLHEDIVATFLTKKPYESRFHHSVLQPFRGLQTVDWQALPAEVGGSGTAGGLEAGRATRQTTYVVVDGKKIYLHGLRHGGCGGACETHALGAAPAPVIADEERYFDEPSYAKSASTYAPHGQLLQSGDGQFIAVSLDGDRLRFERLTPQAEWALECEFALAPESLRESQEPDVKLALAVIDALEAAANRLRGDAGDCGTAVTHGRWGVRMHLALEQTLYRPWGVEELAGPEGTYYFDERALYAGDLENLHKWSLTGTREFAALGAYERQFHQTSVQLARFYERRFGWASTDAAQMAEAALGAAVSAGFSFPVEYEPFSSESERALRRALIDKAPIDTIRALALDFPPFRSDPEVRSESDSILGLAVDQPAALAYLLERGADPDAANAFGKTPLMYAAQANQLRSVELLLAQGADPNAETTRPGDRCYYVLDRTRVTPLHYAVRYASPVVVDRLLAGGAVPFSRHRYNSPGDPIDWLRQYTGAEAAERNPHIGPEDALRLAKALQVPADDELTALARDFVRRAEADYAAGNVTAAYRSLRIALRADATNLRALTDLSLVGIKAGRLGPALAAGEQALAAKPEVAIRAAALFNRGLACLDAGPRGLLYDGTYYCSEGVVEPFVASWLAQPTRARAEKLDQLFLENEVASCVVTNSEGDVLRAHFSYDSNARPAVQRVYLFHSASVRLGTGFVEWRASVLVTNGGQQRHERQAIHAPLVARHVIGDSAISVFETSHPVGQSATVGGQVCVHGR